MVTCMCHVISASAEFAHSTQIRCNPVVLPDERAAVSPWQAHAVSCSCHCQVVLRCSSSSCIVEFLSVHFEISRHQEARTLPPVAALIHTLSICGPCQQYDTSENGDTLWHTRTSSECSRYHLAFPNHQRHSIRQYVTFVFNFSKFATMYGLSSF
jgi:hypothetical protein